VSKVRGSLKLWCHFGPSGLEAPSPREGARGVEGPGSESSRVFGAVGWRARRVGDSRSPVEGTKESRVLRGSRPQRPGGVWRRSPSGWKGSRFFGVSMSEASVGGNNGLYPSWRSRELIREAFGPTVSKVRDSRCQRSSGRRCRESQRGLTSVEDSFGGRRRSRCQPAKV
jgi:hypothetical protein